MRVIHWFPNYLAGGGVANSVACLANAQSRRGANVTVVSRSHRHAVYGSVSLDQNIAVVEWNGGRAVGRGSMVLHTLNSNERKRLASLNPDVVHVHAEFNPDNWWAPRVWSCPVVLSPHGAFHAGALGRRPWAKRLYLAAARPLLYSRVDAFHALNRAEATDLAQALDSNAVYSVPGGPSPGVEQAVVAPEGPNAGSGRSIRFLYVGRLDVTVKGLDVLVKGFAQATRRSSMPMHLTLLGPDTKGGAAVLKQLAADTSVGDRIDVRGPVPTSEVPGVLAEADIYVQLSRNEGSPLSLNDALVLGKPVVVSSRVGTISDDTVGDLPHVLVTDPEIADAAAALAKAADRFPDLARSAAHSSGVLRQYLSWERAADVHLAKYAACVANAQPSDDGAGPIQ